MSPVSSVSRRLRLFGASLALAAIGLTGNALVAHALSGPGGTGGVTASCSSTNQGSTCPITVTFTGPTGQPECNVAVSIATSGISGSSVKPTQTTTNCNGQVQAVFSAGSGCGTATTTFATSDASVQTQTTVACGSGALPNTSTVAPSKPAWFGAVAALCVLVILGAAIAIRRVRAAT